MSPLLCAARNGPYVLAAGLVAGLVTPPQYNIVVPAIPAMVVLLLFLSVLRTDLRRIARDFGQLHQVAGTALLLQLAVPLCVLAIGHTMGLQATPLLLALTLVFSAPSIVGSPNICVMLGAEPAPALRLMVVGTLLLPVTVLPVFWASSQLGDVGDVLRASGRLVVTLGATILVAGLTRHWLLSAPSENTTRRLDGLSAITLAVFVVGLMPAVSEVALRDPAEAALWLAAACLANFGAQLLVFAGMRQADPSVRVATAVIAGNRNIALFLVALPQDITASIMVFVGCYQIPMYLTPLVLGRLYRNRFA